MSRTRLFKEFQWRIIYFTDVQPTVKMKMSIQYVMNAETVEVKETEYPFSKKCDFGKRLGSEEKEDAIAGT